MLDNSLPSESKFLDAPSNLEETNKLKGTKLDKSFQKEGSLCGTSTYVAISLSEQLCKKTEEVAVDAAIEESLDGTTRVIHHESFCDTPSEGRSRPSSPGGKPPTPPSRTPPQGKTPPKGNSPARTPSPSRSVTPPRGSPQVRSRASSIASSARTTSPVVTPRGDNISIIQSECRTPSPLRTPPGEIAEEIGASALNSTNASIQHSNTLNEALDVLRAEMDASSGKDQSVPTMKLSEDVNEATVKLDKDGTSSASGPPAPGAGTGAVCLDKDSLEDCATVRLDQGMSPDMATLKLDQVKPGQPGVSESPRLVQRPAPLDLGLYVDSPENSLKSSKRESKESCSTQHLDDSLAYSMDSTLRDSTGSNPCRTAQFGASGKGGWSPQQTKELLVAELQKSGSKGQSLAASLNDSQASLASLALSHASLGDSLEYSLGSSAGGSLQNSLAGGISTTRGSSKDTQQEPSHEQLDEELSQSIRQAFTASPDPEKDLNVNSGTIKTEQNSTSRPSSAASANITGSQLEMFTAAVAGAEGMNSSLQADLLAFLKTLPPQTPSASAQADKPT
eukprot:gnl/MRDRNA2_/MRDRNA2_27317_c0_seq1.p1 gnl/MRDRNA2_/MRDRNA2_27317_c0~~gnl/MRDRNA2_/MRDRNA2_27317_c0_seq1.p1  ORF type:complete len:563 (-),score=99.10 gnl/MRDRNA2_/MRDRNA2_27317_c0_seq1:25-1713(-)